MAPQSWCECCDRVAEEISLLDRPQWETVKHVRWYSDRSVVWLSDVGRVLTGSNSAGDGWFTAALTELPLTQEDVCHCH